MKIVFLLEERSMAELLDILLPKILPSDVAFQTIPHEGKSDLEQSIPRKLRGWQEPGVVFVVVRDNDGADCFALKERLAKLCSTYGRSDTLVRIVCQQLECWYLGDLAAVDAAYGRTDLSPLQNARQYRQPDTHTNGDRMMCKLEPRFTKVQGAKMIAPYMNPDINASSSFRVFIEGVRKLAASAISS